jgi:hypothetical protein
VKLIVRIAAAPLFGVCLSAGACPGSPQPAEEPSEEQLRSLRLQAARGDSRSAMELFTYHGSDCRNEIEDLVFWLRLAAEQQSCEGMYEYGRMLSGTGKDKVAGEAWKARAVAAGCKPMAQSE